MDTVSGTGEYPPVRDIDSHQADGVRGAPAVVEDGGDVVELFRVDAAVLSLSEELGVGDGRAGLMRVRISSKYNCHLLSLTPAEQDQDDYNSPHRL